MTKTLSVVVVVVVVTQQLFFSHRYDSSRRVRAEGITESFAADVPARTDVWESCRGACCVLQ